MVQYGTQVVSQGKHEKDELVRELLDCVHLIPKKKTFPLLLLLHVWAVKTGTHTSHFDKLVSQTLLVPIASPVALLTGPPKIYANLHSNLPLPCWKVFVSTVSKTNP